MMNTEGVRATIDVTSSQSGLDNTIAMIKKLKTQINELDPSTIKLASNVAKLGFQMQKTQTEAAKSAVQMAKEEAQIIKNSAAKEQNALKTEKLRLQVEKMSNSVNKSSTSFSLSSFSLAAMGVNLVNVIGLAKKLSGATQQLIQNSADYIETQNLFEVSMGKTTDQAEEFVTQMSRAFNLNDRNLKSAIGTFNLLGNQMGLTSNQALTFSETLTKLAVDMSSLRNVDVETAFTKLRAGISGEVKPLRQWGIDITEATLKQEALAHGITKSFTQMSYAEKSLLRYSAILRQTTADQGDYARTLESPAQLMKQIREQVQALGIAIGNVLLPMLYKVLTPLLSIIMVLKEIFVWLGSLFKLSTNFGDTSANTALEIAEDTEDALGGAVKKAKELKKWLGGYDELNNITPSSSSASAGAGSSPSVGIDPEFLKLLSTYDNKMGEVANKAAEIRDRILEWLGFTINENGEIVKLNDGLTNFEKIVGTVGILIGAWGFSKVLTAITKMTGGFVTIWGWLKKIAAFTGLTGLFNGVLEGIQAYQMGLGTIGEVFQAFVLQPLITFIGHLAGIAAIIVGIIELIKGIQEIMEGNIIQGVLQVVEGIALIVAGIALICGAWIPALVALVVAFFALLAQFIVENWEAISQFFTDIWNWFNDTIITPVVEWLSAIAQFIYDNVIAPIISFFEPIIAACLYLFELVVKNVWDIFSTLFEFLVKLITKIWEIFSKIVEIFVALFKALYDYVISPIVSWISGVASWVYEKALRPFFNWFKDVGMWIYDHIIKKVIDWITDIKDRAVGMFTGVTETVINFVSDLFKSIFNGVFGAAESMINKFIDGLNWVIDIINEIPKVDIDRIDRVEFPRFESGGMPEVGSLFVAGEGKTTEFVGDIGGRTNVVNEKQLEAALYSALMRANGAGANNDEIVNEIYIGGTKTDTILNRRRMRRQNMTGRVSA